MIKNAMRLRFSSIFTLLIIATMVGSTISSSSDSSSSSSSSSSSNNNDSRDRLDRTTITIEMSSSDNILRKSKFYISNSNTNRTYNSYINLDQIQQNERRKIQQKTSTTSKNSYEQKQKVKEILQKMPQPNINNLEKININEFNIMTKKHNERGLNWFGDNTNKGSTNGISISSQVLVDPSQYYDKWAQAYRMLGGYIDCDHDKSNNNNHHSGDNNNNQNNNNNQRTGCSRWMIWASYVNPNYQGYGYDEYFSNNPSSTLDCHSPDTEWQLLGVYRQEFYQYVEQISKHLWAIDEYEYVVALAGLAYMTKYECFQVGQDSSGNSIKASVAPKPYGKWEMALYTDDYCLIPDESIGVTYDSYGLGSDVYLGSKDKNDDVSGVADWWYDAQEYTLTDLNDVYEEFKYCTSCVDYPTYQDGYFIGDYGTDDDDLINQCWKFYSHSSYTCEPECIAMAHAQGTILSIKYGDTVFGKNDQNFYQQMSSVSTRSTKVESPMSRLLASAFLTASFILFIATFLAFAVARRSRYRESRSSKSRRLLDSEGGADGERRVKSSSGGGGGRSKSSRRTKSRPPSDGDGLFRSEGGAGGGRSKSRDRRASSSRRSSSKRRSRSKSYDAPN